MYSLKTARCNNEACSIQTFEYASCNLPICPLCGFCSNCGYPESKHEDDTCPETCQLRINSHDTHS